VSIVVWVILAGVVAVLLLAVGFRAAIRSLRRFVRAFWPHS
jgi:hypothetical protein